MFIAQHRKLIKQYYFPFIFKLLVFIYRHIRFFAFVSTSVFHVLAHMFFMCQHIHCLICWLIQLFICQHICLFVCRHIRVFICRHIQLFICRHSRCCLSCQHIHCFMCQHIRVPFVSTFVFIHLFVYSLFYDMCNL